MPRKNHTQTTERPIRDVPSAGFRCGSYLDGHNVHYIPALKLSVDRAAVDARLTWDDDALHLTIGRDVVRVQNHNPLAELRDVHSAVLGDDWQIDTFRRHMQPLLEETGDTTAGHPGRPAALYRKGSLS